MNLQKYVRIALLSLPLILRTYVTVCMYVRRYLWFLWQWLIRMYVCMYYVVCHVNLSCICLQPRPPQPSSSPWGTGNLTLAPTPTSTVTNDQVSSIAPEANNRPQSVQDVSNQDSVSVRTYVVQVAYVRT